MKRVGFGFLSLLMFSLFIAPHSFADSSVTIINNSVNSSSNTSSSDCHTTVHTVVNGKEEDYTSDNCGDVNMDDGNNSVHISNNSGTDNMPSPTVGNGLEPFATYTPIPTYTPMPRYTPMPTISPKDMKKEVAGIQHQITEQEKKMKEQQKNFLQQLQSFFAKLFIFRL